MVSPYSRPFSSTVNLKISGNFSYTIIDNEGKTIETGHSKNEVTIGSGLEPGKYTIKIQTVSKTKFIKVVKVK